MTRLEMQKLTKDEFNNLLKAVADKKEFYITVPDQDNKPIKKLLSKNGKIYFNNNFALNINRHEDNVYLSIDFHSVDDRISIAKKKVDSPIIF